MKSLASTVTSCGGTLVGWNVGGWMGGLPIDGGMMKAGLLMLGVGLVLYIVAAFHPNEPATK